MSEKAHQPEPGCLFRTIAWGGTLLMVFLGWLVQVLVPSGLPSVAFDQIATSNGAVLGQIIGIGLAAIIVECIVLLPVGLCALLPSLRRERVLGACQHL